MLMLATLDEFVIIKNCLQVIISDAANQCLYLPKMTTIEYLVSTLQLCYEEGEVWGSFPECCFNEHSIYSMHFCICSSNLDRMDDLSHPLSPSSINVFIGAIHGSFFTPCGHHKQFMPGVYMPLFPVCNCWIQITIVSKIMILVQWVLLSKGEAEVLALHIRHHHDCSNTELWSELYNEYQEVQ